MGRDELDRYYTPPQLALACMESVPINDGESILEPSVGRGAFVQACNALYPMASVQCCDADPAAPFSGSYHNVDFLEYEPDVDIDWVVGNPPYKNGQEHVERALCIANVGVAFLLRYSFLSSMSRHDFWRGAGSCLYHIKIVAPRPSFTDDGKSDSSGYGWFVWVKGYTGSARIMPSWNWKKTYDHITSGVNGYGNNR